MSDAKLLTGRSQQHILWLSERIGMHRQMLSAWQGLQQAAQSAGFELAVASGFRDFDRQLAIWNNKYSGISTVKDRNNQTLDINGLSDSEKIGAILLYSALPGASRHHWGTDVDIYAPNLLAAGQQLQLEPWEYQPGGPFAELSAWLREHAASHDFFLPYDIYRGGVAPEPWHLSYAPLAAQYQQALQPQMLAEALATSDILGKDIILSMLPEIFQRYISNIAGVNHD